MSQWKKQYLENIHFLSNNNKKRMATKITFLNKTSAQECKPYSVYIQHLVFFFL